MVKKKEETKILEQLVGKYYEYVYIQKERYYVCQFIKWQRKEFNEELFEQQQE